MKKQLVIFFILTALLNIGMHAETTNWQEDDRIIKVIDDNLKIEHKIGNIISGEYSQNVLDKMRISSGTRSIEVLYLGSQIDYSQGQLNFLGTLTFVPPHMLTGTTTTIDAFKLTINNITTPEAFEKHAQDWIKTEVSKIIFSTPKTYLDTKPGYKELLTQAFQLAVKKWKELIVIFNTDIQEQLQSLQKKSNQSKVRAAIEKAKEKLQNVKAKLMKFKA
jgi:hypothetical protein